MTGVEFNQLLQQIRSNSPQTIQLQDDQIGNEHVIA